MTKRTILNVKFYNHQIFTSLRYNAIEIEKFLKAYEIWVFFEKKIIDFFKKKLEIFECT